MTSTWEAHDIEARVLEILGDVPLMNPSGHHFGRPFMTAYQLAIEFDRRWPESARAIDKPVGGRGSGESDSLARYLANQLSRRIKASRGSYPVEGAFVSNQHVDEMRFRSSSGSPVVSSSAGRPQDLSMYRLADLESGCV